MLHQGFFHSGDVGFGEHCAHTIDLGGLSGWVGKRGVDPHRIADWGALVGNLGVIQQAQERVPGCGWEHSKSAVLCLVDGVGNIDALTTGNGSSR